MLRKLLATTAIASVLATSAFAQATAPATGTQPAMNGQPAAEPAAPAAEPMAPAADTAASGTEDAGGAAPTADIAYMQKLGADQYLAMTLDGSDVYATNAEDAETAGEIENFVVGNDGAIAAVVVDMGTFLGDDAKTVAIPFDQIEWTTGADNAPRASLKATRDDLAAAPAFDDDNDGAAGTTTGAATGGAMSGAPATDSAIAPAGGAMAPGAATTGTAGSSDMAAGTMAPATPAPAGQMADAAPGEYLATVGPDQSLSEDLVGSDVFAGPAQDADKIGNINDLVIASSGRVEGFVVGVGGFLGVGEKDVGVPFDNISMTTNENGNPHAALAATKEQLTNAPTFESGDDATQTAANNSAAAPATGAATTGAATTGDTATGAAATGMAAGTAAGTAASGMATDTTDATATASTSGSAATSAMTPVTGEELSADNLMGTSVYGPDNQTIGSIGDIALTPEGQVDAVIVDVGGFLGIGAKPVAVAMDNLQFMRDSSGSTTLTTQFTQDQLRNAPEYNRDTYAQNRDQMRIENPGDIPAAPAEESTETPAAGTGAAPAAGTTTQ